MESSQVDIMASQLPDSEVATQLISSSAPSGSTSHKYSHLVLFNRGNGVKSPFKKFPKKQFFISEIRDEWIKYQMQANSRKRKLKPISSLPGVTMSLFAKLESGMFLKSLTYLHL